MAKTIEYVVQCFEQKRGSLVAGPRDVTWNEDDAVKRALVQSLRFPGVIAFMIANDASLPAAPDVLVLKQYGIVPSEFIERLRQGPPPPGPRAPTSPRIRRG